MCVSDLVRQIRQTKDGSWVIWQALLGKTTNTAPSAVATVACLNEEVQVLLRVTETFVRHRLRCRSFTNSLSIPSHSCFMDNLLRAKGSFCPSCPNPMEIRVRPCCRCRLSCFFDSCTARLFSLAILLSKRSTIVVRFRVPGSCIMRFNWKSR